MIIFLKIVSEEGFYANDLLGQKVSWSQNGHGQWVFWGLVNDLVNKICRITATIVRQTYDKLRHFVPFEC